MCSIALIFIMFYDKFETEWSEAKPVTVKAIFFSLLNDIFHISVFLVVLLEIR